MSWQDRIRPSIWLTSPSGQTFTCGWKGDDQSVKKRVGRHAYPGIDKEVAQDMGLDSLDVPLTLLFEGPDNDKESRRFMRAFSERGVWTIVHPVDGTFKLQPLDCKRPVQPITSGNLTTLTTSWMEPADESGATSTSDPASDVADSADKVNQTATEDFAQGVKQDTASQVASLRSSIKAQVAKIKKAILSANARVNAIQNQINEGVTGATIDAISIAGGIIQLMNSPGMVSGSASARAKSLARIGAGIIADLPEAIAMGLLERNQAVVGEIFLNATLTAMSAAVVSGLPETRPQALSMLSDFDAFTALIASTLDTQSGKTAGLGIERQYFGGRATAQAIASLRSSVARYLLGILFDLKTERRFTLDRNRATLEVAITEYGANAGNADELYGLFCRSNDLHGRELLHLPEGREVMIYG